MKLAVLASGGGSNFESLCRAVDDGRLNATIVALISDRSDAGALRRAQSRDISCAVVKQTKSGFADALLGELGAHGADFIALAGYLKMIPPAVVNAYTGRIINIHPSLLPAFGGKGMFGLRVHRAVIDYGAKLSGATVHLVDNTYDTGPVVMQDSVRVLASDTPETLAARVLKVEHRIYPEALQLFASDRVTVSGRIVSISSSQQQTVI